MIKFKKRDSMKHFTLTLVCLFIFNIPAFSQQYTVWGCSDADYAAEGLIPKPVSSEESAFFRAIQTGNIEEVRKMIDADFNIKQKYRWFGGDICSFSTPLHIAAQFNNLEIMQFLLDQGADVNSIVQGITPLGFAASNNKKEAVEFLLKKGAKVDLGSQSPLWLLAARYSNANIEVAQILINAGANVNFKIDIGRTPLHLAVEGSNIELVDLLIKHGADINARENDGTTPLDSLSMFSRGNQELGEKLKKLGAKTVTTDYNCKEYCYKDIDENTIIKSHRFIKWNYKYFLSFGFILTCAILLFIFFRRRR